MTSQKHKPDNSRRGNKDRRKQREDVIEMDRRRERRSNSPQFPSVFRTLTVLCVIFLSVHSALGQTSQNILRPIITASKRPLVELELATLECKLDTSITPTSSAPPLTWSRVGGLPSGYTVTPSSTDIGEGFTSYTSVLSFIPVGRDHEQMFTCSATLAQFTGQTTYLPEVILKPSLPVVTGPSVVNAFATETWRCVTSGASINHPSVYFRNGDGIHLSLGISSSPTADVDADGIIVFTENVLLTTELPATQPTYTLTCNVVHSYQDYNFFAEASLSITVRYVPQVTKLSTDTVMTTEGIRQTISCVVENSSPVATSMSWTKDGIPVVVTGSTRYEGATLDSPSLVIRSVVQSDEGEYICSATNSEGTGSFVVPTTLVVRRTPVISYTSLVFTGNLGGELTLPCPVDAIPPPSTIRWWRELNGVSTFLNIPNEPRYTGGTIVNERYGLTINPLQTSDEEGLYYCQAINDVASGTGDRLTIVVNSQPTINTPATSVYGVEGQQVTLTCEVISLNTLENLYWTKDGLVLSTTDILKFSGGTISEPSLTILTVDQSDAGEYSCVASNLHGTTVSDTITLFAISETEVVGEESQDVTLTCNATPLDSLTDLYWTKDGLRLTTNGPKYSGGTTDTPDLTILSLSSGDSGTYVCVATNPQGTGNGGDIILSLGYQPRITVPSQPITAHVGTVLVLTCNVDANPPITNLNWSTSSGLIISSSTNPGKYSGGLVNNPTLIILSSEIADSDVYYCTAENSVGRTVSSPVDVTVTNNPVIVTPPTNVPVQENQPITLPCVVTSADTLTDLYWTKDGVRLTTSGPKYSGGTTDSPNLVIESLTSVDSGTYVCVATNSFGTTSGGGNTIDVTYRPRITVPSQPITANVGTVLVLTCDVDSNPPITNLNWSTSSGLTISSTSNPGKYSGGLVNNPTLIILSSEITDSNVYYCAAENSVGRTVSSPVDVTVTNNPVIATPPTNVPVQENQPITLPCVVTSADTLTDLYWTKDGVRLTTSGPKYSGGTTDSPNLVIESLTSEDSGTYVCVATNSFGTTSGGGNTIDVTYRPRITVPSQPITANVGTVLVLTCDVDSNPPITNLNWSTSSGLIVSSTSNPGKYSGGLVSNPALIILSSEITDSNVYFCAAENSVGRTVSSPVDVTVTNTPVIVTPPTNVPVQENQPITLPCVVTSADTLTDLYWTKDGVRLTTNGPKYSGGTIDSPNLVIESLTSVDSGTYVCVATNSFGTTSGGDNTIDVTSSTDVVGQENQSVTLTCNANNLDFLTDLYWTKDGLRLTTNGPKYSGGTTDTPDLTILSLSSGDSGTYVCVATNPQGTGNGGDNVLSLGYQPRITVSTQPITANVGTSIVLTCDVDSDPPITNLNWSTSSGLIISSTSNPGKYSGGLANNPALIILSSEITDSGVYYCTAENSVGRTVSSPVDVTVTNTPVIVTPPTNVPVQENQPITLPCVVTSADTLTDLYWTKDGVRLNTNDPKYSGGTTDSPNLVIESLTSVDSGTYVCVATNSFGTTSGGDNTIDVTYRPRITVPSQPITASVGTFIVLTCDVNSDPPITNLNWSTSSGLTISSTSNPGKYSGGLVNNPTLIILSSEIADSNVYYCTAENSVGRTVSSPVVVTVTNTPVIVTPPTNVPVQENQPITLPCVVTSADTLTDLYWTKDGVRLTTSGPKYSGGTIDSPNLVIESLTSEDSGTYVCVATNSFGITPGGDNTIDVTYQPRITVSPQPITANVGTTVVLTCGVDSNPPVNNLGWSTSSGLTISSTSNPGKYSGGLVNNPTLIILSSEIADSDVYYCTAENSVGRTVSSPVVVTVTDTPVIATPPTNVPVQENQPITLPCVVTSADTLTDLYWTKDGVRLIASDPNYSGGTIGSPNLVILSVTSEDSGTYVCVATNSFGTTSGGDNTISLTYPPVVSVSPTSAFIPENTVSYTLLCTVISEPPATSISWSKDSLPLDVVGQPAKYRGSTVDNPHLTIRGLVRSDTGSYVCSASNSLGTGASTPTPLTITYLPEIDFNTDDITASPDTSVTLRCTVTASPEITSLTWLKDGIPLTTNPSKYLGGTTSTTDLTILALTTADSGQYSCRGSNSRGSTTSPSLQLSVFLAPVIDTTNRDIVGLESQDVTLTCNVTPLDTLTDLYWTKDGLRLITNGPKYSGGTTDTPDLTILSLSSGDSGTYVCVATNPQGTGNGGDNVLSLGSPPVVSVSPTSAFIPENTVSYTLLCTVTSEPPATSISWSKDNLPLDVVGQPVKYRGSTVDNPHLTIRGLVRSDTGSYVCSASNSLGTGASPPTPLTITYPPEIDFNTDDIAASPGTSVTLRCTVTASPEISSLTWLKDGIPLPTNPSKYLGGTTSTTDLTILALTTADSGQYSCRGSNSRGSTTSTSLQLSVFLAPVIDTTNRDVVGLESQDVTLTCNVTPLDTLTDLYWTKDGLRLTTNGPKYSGGTTDTPDLTILSLSSGDSGTYVCVATNPQGTGNGGDNVLSLGSPPVVSVSPTSAIIPENTVSYTLLCTVTSEPPATSISWSKDNLPLDVVGQPVKYTGSTVDNPHLTIRGLVRSDTGSYVCSASNSLGTGASTPTPLTITYLPEIDFNTDDIVASPGTSVTLRCSVTASPEITSLTWLKDGVALPTNPSKYLGGTTSTTDLTILALTTADSGQYSCRGSNSRGSTTSPSRQLSVFLAPVIDTTNRDIVGLESQDVTLTCNVTPLDTLTDLYWTKDGLRLTTNGPKYSGGTTDTPDLTILSLSSADSGTYVCVATNPQGTGNGGDNVLSLGSPPVVSVSPTSAFIPENTVSYTLLCTVTSEPPATSISWSKDNLPLDVVGQPVKYTGSTVDNPHLTIRGLVRSDTGSYVCSASNSLGTGASPPTPLTITYLPEIDFNTDDIAASPGTSVTLRCTVTASPEITSLTWLKDGTPLPTNPSKYLGGTTSTTDLTILAVTTADSGQYSCRGSNSRGSTTSASLQLSVFLAPVIDTTNRDVVGLESQDVTLTCNVTPLDTLTDLYWTKDGLRLTTNGPKYSGGTTDTPDLTILSLSSGDSGTYVCVATNPQGTGNGGDNVLSLGSFPVINTPVTSVVAVENLPVTLTCAVNSQETLIELYWTRDGATLTTTDPARYSGGTISTPSLTILTPGNADVGTYVCVARNSVGLSRSDNIGVTLNFRPRILVPSEDITSAPGGIVRLDCQVTAATPGVVDLYWNKAGLGRIDSAASAAYSGGTLGDPTLVISSAQFSDSGEYTCVASNSVGTTISDVVSVSIISIPQVSIAPATTTLEEGSGNVVFSCIISANPAVSRVSWTKDGSSIDRVSNVGKYVGGTVANSDLTVNSVDRNDAGDYRCEAENSQGIGFSTVARLDITYEPTITVGSTNIVGTEGGTITLTCGVAAFPLPTNFYWNKNGTRLDLSSPIGKYSGGTLTNYDLTISNLDSTSDTDVYTCVAENSRGNTVSDPIALGVSFDPVVNVDTNVVGKEGQPLTIRCEVSMFPPATSILWFKDGTEIRVADDPTRYSGGTLSNPTLTVLSASGADSGTYICQANNNVVTTDSPSITVLVTYAPKVTTTTNAVETTASASTSVTLVCQVDAVPLISSLVWTRIPSNAINPVATVVTIGGRFSGASTTSPNLIISGVNSGDAGTYFCDAGNSEGSSRSPDMALTVRYGPENLAVTQDPSGVLSVGDTFTLTCSADSFPLPSAYTWYRGDTVMANSATFSTQATTDDFATYRCDVANSISSASSSMLVDVRFPPTPKSTTPEIRIVQIGGSVTLTCDVSANPTPIQYRWFKDPNEISGATERTLNVQVASVADVGTYSCLASNSIGVGTSNPEFRLVEGDPVVGQSTADEGLSTATIILIVVICIILLIIIILLLIFCCFQGTFAKCCGRSPEASRVAPTPYTKPPATNGTGAFGPVYTPEANGVSKVDIEASPFTARTPTATGLIISVPEMTGGRAHHLPPLGTEAPVEENYYREEKRRTRKKRRHRRKPEDTDALTIDIQGDSPTPERPQD